MHEIHRIYPDYDGPIEYRALPHVANSDLKEIVSRHNGKLKPDNLEEIFAFGNLFDALILEPHKANIDHAKLEHALDMKKNLFKDPLIQQIFTISDFRRQHEFYKLNIHGVKGGKCKCDGDSRMNDLVFELKGLSVTSDKQFEEAIDHLDYDQASAWYLDVTGRRHYIIAGGSKKDPRKVFKRYIDRDHKFYKSGIQKVEYATMLWKQYGFV